MNVDSFLQHWCVKENPFMAEEAREDLIYRRIMDKEMTHPDFEKVYGSPEHPGTAVVFGEKGSGKTAMRLLIEERLKQYNQAHPERMAWVALYDDLDSMIDSVSRQNGRHSMNGHNLSQINLQDHMDAILSLVVTKLVDFLLGGELDVVKSRKKRRQLRRMSYQKRIDLAVMAMIYDQVKTSNPMARWHHLKYLLRVGRAFNLRTTFWLSTILLVLAVGAGIASTILEASQIYLLSAAGIGGLVSILGYFSWVVGSNRARRLAKQIAREVRVIERPSGQLRKKLGDLAYRDLQPLPLPIPGNEDSRYELTTRLMQILEEIGYFSMVVLVDRVDEPALVNGEPEKMRSIIWPMLNNKFLQQENIGFKLLLPIELGHLLRREGQNFFQQARLDKQNMIDRLEWSGSTLYDICTKRLLSCLSDNGTVNKLTDLFQEDVSMKDITDALDQMHQPRDAFKFLYRVISEHCQNTPDEQPEWRISKSVLEHIKKLESQRVQDLYRGLTPA